MNFLKNNYKGNHSFKYCQCESEITNKHLYEKIFKKNTLWKHICRKTGGIGIHIEHTPRKSDKTWTFQPGTGIKSFEPQVNVYLIFY